MSTSTRRVFGQFVSAALAAALTPAAVSAQTDAPGKNRVVMQVSDSDPVRWTVALNNIRSLQASLGSDGVEIEVVVYGPGIGMLKKDSAVAQRIAETIKTGVPMAACENTMKGLNLVTADMLPAASYVPSGVVEVMRKQQQGWTYIRP